MKTSSPAIQECLRATLLARAGAESMTIHCAIRTCLTPFAVAVQERLLNTVGAGCEGE